MHISKLTIQNFRNFGDPAFEFAPKPFTLVLGENNIGKTNLLTAVALLFSQEISVVQRRSLELDDINFESVAKFKSLVANGNCDWNEVAFPEVMIDAHLTGMTDDQHCVIGDWYTGTDLRLAQVTYRFAIRSNFDRQRWIAEQREMLKQLRHDQKQSVEENDFWRWVDFPIGDYRYAIYGGGQPSNECDSHFLNMLRVEILDALRDARRELEAGGEQRLLYRVLRQNAESRFSNLKEHLVALEQAVDQNPALSGLRTEVGELLKRVSLATPDEDNSIRFQFSAPEAAELLKKIGMIYGANPITVTRNGLGRNNLLYVALVLSQLAKSENPVLSNDSYVCYRFVGIEEPEAHLHPHLQDHLASNIEELRREHDTALQLVLTSHSTHIAARLSLENTAVLFRDHQTGRLACHYVLDGIDTTKEKDAIRFLSLYLDATKSRMFFARRIILVEGIAEQTLLPVLFEGAKNMTIESTGGSIVNANGVAFRHFLKVVRNGFFKRCVVLTDRDSGTASEDRAEDLKQDFDDRKLIHVGITEASTFEKDLVAANSSGKGKEILLDSLTATKPNNGPKFRTVTGRGKIDVDAFYHEIEASKAEFAFNLVAELRKQDQCLALPKYISEAFDFICLS